jgi:flagellar assembly factor FliW
MKVKSLRFGQLEVPDSKIIDMARPILGFEHLERFCLVDMPELRPLLWMQSVEDPSVAFLIGNPLLFQADYTIKVNPQEIAELKVNRVESVETYVIVTIPEDPRATSVNMQGPILINTDTNLAKQLVLVNSPYQVRHFVLEREDMLSREVESPVEELVEL